MVQVNLRRRSKKRYNAFTSPVAICLSVFVILILINKYFPNEMGEEKEVLTQLYQGEKDVISHMIHHGVDGGKGVSSSSSSTAKATTTTESQPSGWKPVHIFYGDQKHLAYLGRESQVQQDKLVMKLLKNPKDGYFIDLAANDATNLSNTYQLEKQLDWNGICIEPNPIYWTSLSHRKCNIAAAVVGKTRMEEVRFRMYADLKKRAPSGGIEGFIDPKIPRSKEKSADVYTVPFLEILEKFDAPHVIEYLSLDVEGSEFLVMEAFPFDKYTFMVMTIERPRQNLVDLLIQNDYVYLAANNAEGEETSWVHKSFQDAINHDAIKEVGWVTGDTKWLTLSKDGKPPHVISKKGKKL
jgi:hypothetical protein